MAGGRDEIEKGVDAVVLETGITLDAGLLCKKIVVLALDVPNNLLKATKRRQIMFLREGELGGLHTRIRCRYYRQSRGCLRQSKQFERLPPPILEARE